jgi:7-carboxy-7-deazaguanine synthase
VLASAPRSSDSSALHDATFPVVEVFGPTVQGEGPDAGRPAYFVRFGGCDFRCSWCDSMHAVEPGLVRAAERLSASDVIARLRDRPAGPDLVVLSGGNPALLELGRLVEELQREGRQVAVETQGSVWRDWLWRADTLVVSPKGPSSDMLSSKHADQFRAFMGKACSGRATLALKIVVFDAEDLEWATRLASDYRQLPLYLSAGTEVGLSEEQTIGRLRERYRWLCEAVSLSTDLCRTHVLPQLHVIAWGTAKGV